MPATIEQLYNFESAIETAIKSALLAAGIKEEYGIEVYTSQDETDFQNIRPRIELEFVASAPTGHRITSNATAYLPDSWEGTLQVALITNSSDGTSGVTDHSGWRARLRYELDLIESTLVSDAGGDDTLLPYHSVNKFLAAGSTPTMKPEDGYIESRLAYEIHFNIRPTAWPS